VLTSDRTRPRRPRLIAGILLVTGLLAAATTLPVVAQVATLATPAPDSGERAVTPAPVDGQEGILAFVACLREQGIDVPDPQFGLDGNLIGGAAAFAAIDFTSPAFLDAAEACQDILAALQPELDPEELAERNDELLRFAECMRREGVDFPDPDPLRGLTISDFRGEDGALTIDPFSSAFLDASSVCRTEIGLQLLPSPAP
jgi:hypothetical protein